MNIASQTRLTILVLTLTVATGADAGWRDGVSRVFGRNTARRTPAQQQKSYRGQQQATATTPLRGEDALEAARDIIAAMAAKEGAVIWNSCDVDRVVARTMVRMPSLPRSQFNRLQGEIKSQLAPVAGPLGSMVAMAESGVTLSPTRSKTRDGYTAVLVLGTSEDTNVRYYEWLMRRDPATNNIVVDDIYVTTRGGYITQVYADAAATMLADSPADMATLSPATREYVLGLSKMRRMQAAVERSEHELFEQLYEELPKSLQERRVVEGIVVEHEVIKLIQKINDGDDPDAVISAVEHLKTTVDTYRARHPGEIQAEIRTISALANFGEFDFAADSLTRIEKELGPSAVFRANVASAYALNGNPAEGSAMLEKVIELEPRNIAIYELAINTFLECERPTLVGEWLSRIDREFVIEWDDLADLVYADGFDGTLAHGRWLDYLGDRAPQRPLHRNAANGEPTYQL